MEFWQSSEDEPASKVLVTGYGKSRAFTSQDGKGALWQTTQWHTPAEFIEQVRFLRIESMKALRIKVPTGLLDFKDIEIEKVFDLLIELQAQYDLEEARQE